MKIKILILLVFRIFHSCKNEETNQVPAAEIDDSALETNNPDGNWELFKVNDTAFSIENVYSLNYGAQPRIQIDMATNKLGGFTGCNNWDTSLSIRNNSLVLEDPIEKHEQGCGGTWESEFLNFLRNNQSFSIREKNLLLTSKDNKTMTFKRVK